MKPIGCIIALIFFCSVCAKGPMNLVMKDGELLDVRDHCNASDITSCGVGRCCTRKHLQYIDEFIGARPVARIECAPLGTLDDYCHSYLGNGFCPCVAGLMCQSGSSVCVKAPTTTTPKPTRTTKPTPPPTTSTIAPKKITTTTPKPTTTPPTTTTIAPKKITTIFATKLNKPLTPEVTTKSDTNPNKHSVSTKQTVTSLKSNRSTHGVHDKSTQMLGPVTDDHFVITSSDVDNPQYLTSVSNQVDETITMNVLPKDTHSVKQTNSGRNTVSSSQKTGSKKHSTFLSKLRSKRAVHENNQLQTVIKRLQNYITNLFQ